MPLPISQCDGSTIKSLIERTQSPNLPFAKPSHSLVIDKLENENLWIKESIPNIKAPKKPMITKRIKIPTTFELMPRFWRINQRTRIKIKLSIAVLVTVERIAKVNITNPL